MSLRQLIASRRIHSDMDRSIKINRRLDMQVGYTKEGDPTLKINLPGIQPMSLGLLEDFLKKNVRETLPRQGFFTPHNRIYPDW